MFIRQTFNKENLLKRTKYIRRLDLKTEESSRIKNEG